MKAGATRAALPRVALVAGAFLAALVALAVPLATAAEADPRYDVPEGCEVWVDDQTNLHSFDVIASGHPYLKCEDEQDDDSCMYWSYDEDEYFDPGYLCLLEEGGTFVECLDDVRSVFGDPEYDDEGSFWGSDTRGFVLVPDEAAEEQAWWLAEFETENALAEDGDYHGGQGCESGRNRPEHASCEAINDRKDEIRDQRGHILEQYDVRHIGAMTSGQRDSLSGEERADLEELRELDDLGGLIPDSCWGTYPSDYYQLSWENDDNDAELMQNSNRLMGWLASILFSLAKTAIVLTLWLVELAFTFDINQYRAQVGEFAANVDVSLVHLGNHDLSLFLVAWFAVFAYAGFQALRGQVGRAGGEVLLTIVLAGVGVVLIGNFFPHSDGGSYQPAAAREGTAYEEDSYFDFAGNLLNGSALAMLRIANDEDPDIGVGDLGSQEVQRLIRDTNGTLHLEFIERPYLFINYGRYEFSDRPTPSRGEMDIIPDGIDYQWISCQEVVGHLMAVPDSSGAWAQRFLRRNSCDEIADWNHSMTLERLLNTTLVTAVAFVVAATVGVAAVALVVAKFLVAVLFVALPVAVLLALLPGSGRSLAWGWGATMLNLWLVAMGMGLVLALLLMGVDAVNTSVGDRDLAERWVMILLVVVTMAALRKRMLSGAQTVAKSLQDQLSSIGGDGSGAGRTQLNDMDMTGVERGTSRASLATKAALVGGGALAIRSAARTTGWLAHNGPGRVRRFAVNEYGRQKSSRMARHWHAANSREGRLLGQAHGQQTGSKKTREEFLAKDFGQGAGDRHQQLLSDAAGAQADFDVVRQVGGRATKTNDERQSITRLLGTKAAANWGSASRTERYAMVNRARKERDAAVNQAGGERFIDASARARAEQYRQQTNELGRSNPGTVDTYERRERTRNREDRIAGIGDTDVRRRNEELADLDVLSRDEGRAKVAEHTQP